MHIVFAVGGSAGGLVKAASPQAAFESARYQLQLAAVRFGGNAVVACRSGYWVIRGALGGTQRLVDNLDSAISNEEEPADPNRQARSFYPSILLGTGADV